MIVGLTGSFGTGKSFVASVFKKLGHKCKYGPCHNKSQKRFVVLYGERKSQGRMQGKRKWSFYKCK